MTDLVFHKAEKYIEEDLEYYFSGLRDIHSQVKPGQNIYSFTPDSKHLNMSFEDGKVGNVFYPFAPGSVDRIYIGISFPLFANSWGAAFLKHLMNLVKPDGCVVLPVYPEMQASEKNYWSRSILENIFISRSRWKGMSNIWAENDGVMSMRIGRKHPPTIHSTATYLLTQGSQSLLRGAFAQDDKPKPIEDSFVDFHLSHWKSANINSIVERILQDHFGRKAKITLCSLGQECSSPLLAIEMLLSPYVNVTKAVSEAERDKPSTADWQAVAASNSRKLKDRLTTKNNNSDALAAHESFNAVTLLNRLDASDMEQSKMLISDAWSKLSASGILIIHEQKEDSADNCTPKELTELLSSFGTIKHYSSIVASEHQQGVEISQYSLLVEEELRKENDSKEGVFWVVQKA